MKITQLRIKDKTTALTTMEIETWIEKHELKQRHNLYPHSEKCYDIPFLTHAAMKQTNCRKFFLPQNFAEQKVAYR